MNRIVLERVVKHLFFFAGICALLTGLALCSACAWPSEGWFQRIEQNASQVQGDVKAISENTVKIERRLAGIENQIVPEPERKTTESEIQKALDALASERDRRKSEAPEDSAKWQDTLVTLIYILMGLAGWSAASSSGTRGLLGKLFQKKPG